MIAASNKTVFGCAISSLRCRKADADGAGFVPSYRTVRVAPGERP